MRTGDGRRLRLGAAAGLLLVLAACNASETSPEAQSAGTNPATRTTSEAPRAPEGMRLVGMGDVVVAVPTSWETRVEGCAGRGGSVVFTDSRTISGCGAPGSRTSTLMIAKHGSGALECGGGARTSARRSTA